MDKKYQVFVSSTYEDLREERQEVMNALLELDCIPAVMELFPAANEDQWTLIKEVIDDCDYYVVISGGIYGSIGPGGKSYTEMEYQYAVDAGKPVIAFLHEDPGSLVRDKTETDPGLQKQLEQFQDVLKNRMCKFWKNREELGAVVSRSLVKLQKRHPGIGWVRGNLVPDKDASLEILDLRREIESLKSQLETTRTSAPEGTEELQQGDDEFILNYRCFKERDDLEHAISHNGAVSISWNGIFYAVSPLMIDEASDHWLQSALNTLIWEHALSDILQFAPQNAEHTSVEIISSDFQTIIVQARALGLVEQSRKSHSTKDKSTYWTLTPFGDSVMTQLRALRRTDD